MVVAAALWRHGTGAAAWRRALLSVTAGGACSFLIFSLSAGPASSLLLRLGLPDSQRALAFLPAFQIGLFVALSAAAFVTMRWRAAVTGFAVLGLSQLALVGALLAMAHVTGLAPHVRDVRGWALAGPLLLVAGMVAYDRRRAC